MDRSDLAILIKTLVGITLIVFICFILTSRLFLSNQPFGKPEPPGQRMPKIKLLQPNTEVAAGDSLDRATRLDRLSGNFRYDGESYKLSVRQQARTPQDIDSGQNTALRTKKTPSTYRFEAEGKNDKKVLGSLHVQPED